VTPEGPKFEAEDSGRGVLPPHQLEGLEERCKLPSGVRGRPLTANEFWMH